MYQDQWNNNGKVKSCSGYRKRRMEAYKRYLRVYPKDISFKHFHIPDYWRKVPEKRSNSIPNQLPNSKMNNTNEDNHSDGEGTVDGISDKMPTHNEAASLPKEFITAANIISSLQGNEQNIAETTSMLNARKTHTNTEDCHSEEEGTVDVIGGNSPANNEATLTAKPLQLEHKIARRSFENGMDMEVSAEVGDSITSEFGTSFSVELRDESDLSDNEILAARSGMTTAERNDDSNGKDEDDCIDNGDIENEKNDENYLDNAENDNSDSDTDYNRHPAHSGMNVNDPDGQERNVYSLNKNKHWDRQMRMKGNITKLDIVASTIAIAIRAKLSYTSTELILQNMESMLQDSTLPRTKKSLWSLMSRNDKAGMTRHLYCRQCRSYVGEGDTVNEDCSCTACGPNKKNDKLSYFIEIKIAPQLQQIFSDPQKVESLRYRFTRKRTSVDPAMEDIYDGTKYKEKCEPGCFLNDEYNYSFSLNTDGCSVSISSKASAWPILLQINEFPPHARERNIILAGVWVDTAHPDFNMFLLPTIKELLHLYNEGITWTHPINNRVVVSKFTTLICTVDSMARAPLLNMTLFNGEYGCTYCYEKGKHMSGKGAQRRYPYCNSIRRRSDTEMRKHMSEAFESGNKKFGIKGYSVLSLLPEFDLHYGTVPDSMHNVFLGVVKRHTFLLLRGSAKDPWYAGNPSNLSAINARLIKIRPPSKISRKPRGVETMKDWKASEWKNWILYYALICLSGIIRACDLEHLALLSRGIYILNNRCITLGELQEARLLLKQYVETFQETFGIKNMVYNVHLLNHLADSVESWGPFWTHTAFPYESYNKKIVEKITSAKARPLQIATRYLMIKFIDAFLHDPITPFWTRERIRKILICAPRKESFTLGLTSPSSMFKGLNKYNRTLSDWELQALNSAGYNPKVVNFYQRAMIHNVDYRRRDIHKKETRFCDHFVYCRSLAGFAEITDIISFDHNDEFVNGVFLLRTTDFAGAFGTQHIRKVKFSSQNVFVVNYEDVLIPAIIVTTTTNNFCAVALSNIWETD